MQFAASVIGNDESYRYILWRSWNNKPLVQYIGLYPSDDKDLLSHLTTVSNRLGFGGFCLTNIFALRASSFREVKSHSKPIGAFNDFWLLRARKRCSMSIAIWGNNGAYKNRDEQVSIIVPVLHCFGFTTKGHPTSIISVRKPVRYNNGYRTPVWNMQECCSI